MFLSLIPLGDLRNVYKWVNSLFSEGTFRNLPLAGRLYIFWMHVKFLQRTQKFWVQDEVQDTFSKTSNTEESFPGATHGPGTSRFNTNGYK